MGGGGVKPVPATAASPLSEKPRWEKDIEPLVETAAWNLGNNCRAQPRNGTQICTGFRIRRQAAYSRYRASIPGRVAAEHRGELAKVNGGASRSGENLNVFGGMARPSCRQPMIEYPPSTGIAVPVTKSEAGEARNTAMPAKSADAPQRAAGERARTLSCRPSTCSRARLVRSVSIQPGSTALAWILSGAQATAQDRVNCTMPPLLAA